MKKKIHLFGFIINLFDPHWILNGKNYLDILIMLPARIEF